MATLGYSYEMLGQQYLGTDSWGRNLYIRIYAKLNSQDTTNATSSVTYQSRLFFDASQSSNYIISQGSTQVTTSGTGATTDTSRYTNFEGSTNGYFYKGETVVKTITGTVQHNNTTGVASISASAAFSSAGSWGWSGTASGSIDLPTIPRYFSQTPKMEQTGRTTKTVTIKWTTSENASQSQYSIDDASHWVDVETNINKSTGTMTISGLTAGKSYRIYGDFKRKDSGLWCPTKPYVDVTTFDYAKISSAPNFNDEGNPKITYTNPMGSAVTTLQACIANTDGTGLGVSYRNINKTGTLSYTFNLTDAERNSLRTATTGKKKQVCFYIKTVADNTTYYSQKEVTFEIVNGNPTFTDFAYADTNTTVSNLIGTDQALVQGKSNLQVTISSANKMVAIKQASPKNYTASIDNKTIPANYSTNDVVIDMGTISSSGTQRLTVTAYDSRDNFTPRYKDITIYEYKKPVVNATVERLNNFEDQTTLSIDGEYSKLVVGGEAKNTILNGSYKYRETGGNWTDPNQLSIIATDGRFYCDNVILSLDNSKSFEFEVSITDELDTTTVSLTLDIGKAIFFISSNLRECFIDGDLEVDGTVRIYKQSPFSSLDNFKSFCIYNAPGGITFWTLNINGAVSAAILQKANSNYLSFIHFSYGVNMTQYKYNNGTWSTYT